MTIKNDNDTLQRFIFERCDIRGTIVSLHRSFLEARAHQNLSPTENVILGEFLTAIALLGDSLKFDGILTLQARGDGAIPLIMADTNNHKHIRGIVKQHPQLKLPEQARALPELLGHAVLSMTIDPEKGERYQGIVPLQKESIAQCLNDYFTQSEQLPSFFLIFAEAEHCGGLFLQALPEQVVEDKDTSKEFWQTALQLALTLKQEELFSLDHEEILYRLFHELQCKVFPASPVSFACSCNKERSSNAIAVLGRDDAFALLQEQGTIIINCEFCGKVYRFDENALQKLFSAAH